MRWGPAGLGRYLDGILHALEELLSPEDRLAVYYNSLPGPRLFGTKVKERFVRLPRSTSYNQLGLATALRLDGSDVYFGGANIVPVFSRVPRVLVVHDCLAFRHPETKPGFVGRYLRRWMKLSARHADRIIAISRWSAAEAVHFLGADPGSIEVVYQGVDPRFHPGDGPSPDEALAKLGTDEPFVLHVGASERHKGASTAVEAVRLLRQRGRGVTLIRTGVTGNREAGIVDVGVVGDEALRWLYRRAAVVCVPSTHEGFGLPIIEAMASGTPVVASRAAGLPEAGGDAALYAEPGDVSGFADAIERLLTDQAERERRRTAGLEQAARFRWETSAQRVYDILAEVAARRTRS
jgi:glycosyltransferase involved in cell wall biosynthesis